jgi:hypothetical protein
MHITWPGKGGTPPYIQKQKLTFVEYGADVFPPRLRDSGEVGKLVVDVVELDAPRACSRRVRYVIGARLTANGCIEDELFVHLRVDLYVVLVGHDDALGFDRVELPLLVTFVEDQAVALATKRTPSRKGSSSSPQHPSSSHFSG